jgi:hypothetical protein
MQSDSTEEKEKPRAAWVAALFIIGFVGACLAIAVVIASAMREAGRGWFASLFVGASTGVIGLWFTVWISVLLGLRLTSLIKRFRRER